jgi:hypothetical protein
MTAFGVFSQPFITSNRTWLAEDHGTEIMPGVPLDLTLFTAAQHYPNGFIPDGIVLGKVTATGKYGPYLGTAGDGRQTAVGISFNPISVFNPNTQVPGTLLLNVSTPLFLHGFVNAANLPFTSTNAANGGYLDAAAQTALAGVVFVPAAA